MRIGQIQLYTNYQYYDPKLGLDCNLDKDLSKSEGDNQLVKHKDIGLYLQLYISIDHEKIENILKERNKENIKKT